jgi:hypothetical protein
LREYAHIETPSTLQCDHLAPRHETLERTQANRQARHVGIKPESIAKRPSTCPETCRSQRSLPASHMSPSHDLFDTPSGRRNTGQGSKSLSFHKGDCCDATQQRCINNPVPLAENMYSQYRFRPRTSEPVRRPSTQASNLSCGGQDQTPRQLAEQKALTCPESRFDILTTLPHSSGQKVAAWIKMPIPGPSIQNIDSRFPRCPVAFVRSSYIAKQMHTVDEALASAHQVYTKACMARLPDTSQQEEEERILKEEEEAKKRRLQEEEEKAKLIKESQREAYLKVESCTYTHTHTHTHTQTQTLTRAKFSDTFQLKK